MQLEYDGGTELRICHLLSAGVLAALIVFIVGSAGRSLFATGRSSFTIIEQNLLERCSGEEEIVSLKSSDNVVRDNTLVDCRGAICLPHHRGF